VSIGVRLRLSLLVRALVALGILSSTAIAVVIPIGIVGGILAIALLEYFSFLGELPRLSTILPVPAWTLALGAFAVIFGIYAWAVWGNDNSQDNNRRTGRQPVIEPEASTSSETDSVLVGVAFIVVSLGLSYLLVVESARTVQVFLVTLEGVLVVAAIGAVGLIWVSISEARERLRDLRSRLLEDAAEADQQYPELTTQSRRLAALASVPAPTVYVVDRPRPESFTIGSGTDAAIVLSTKLLEILDEPELEAVLAHEVSHLANRDSRVMAAALTPVLIADETLDQNPTRLGDYLGVVVYSLLKLWGQAGVAVLSKGRERAADTAAASLTGSPAALASALATLDDERRRRPDVDLRVWEQQVAVLDILPPNHPELETGPFQTHPSIERRIEWLRRLAA